MVEAQEFPEDYDGIWANSPAINWTKFLVTGFWPMAVANSYGVPLKFHKLNLVAKAIHDSVRGSDKYYQFHEKVKFDFFSLVGQKTKQGVFTAMDAQVIKEIWDGPRRANGERLWYSFRPGLIHWRMGLPIFATSFILPFMKARPFALCTTFARWVLEDPKAKFENLDKAGFEKLFDATQAAFPTAGADDADLSAFAALGG